MKKRGSLKVKIVFGILAFLHSQALISQVLQEPKVVNEEKFILAMRSNITGIFAVSPYGNINKVKYEGYYAILRISDGKVTEIVYPDWIEPLFKRRSNFVIVDINERIELGEFEFQDIDQIIVPAIIEWINFETIEPQLYTELSKILPKTGYTRNTYVLFPHLIRTGDPIIN